MQPASPEVIAYCREYGTERLWCWFNLGKFSAEETIPSNLEAVWGNISEITMNNNLLTLPPYQFVVMRQEIR